MSQIVQFKEIGSPEVLKIVDVEIAKPSANEVRIQVKALGLNRAEAMFRSGQYLEEPKFPARLGYEAAGIIEAVGEGVTSFKVGDVVSTIPNFSLNSYGMYGDLVLAPVSAVVKHAPTLTFEEASSIWMMFVTAYDALIGMANLTKSDVVLIPAASSSVGIAAIQIANMVGATPIALTRTSKKRAELLKAGAAHVIATEEQDLVAEVFKVTDGRGARVVFDPVGGSTFSKLLDAAAQGAILMIYGDLSQEPITLSALQLVGKRLTVAGAMIMSTSGDPSRLKKATDFINDGLKRGVLKPVIAKVFPFASIVEAHKYLESNQQFGKIVVTV